jgi:hypothetical protein
MAMSARALTIVFAVALRCQTSALAAPPERTLDAAQARAALEQDARSVPWWFWGWSAGFFAASTVQLSLAAATDSDGFRADTAVGGIGSSLGMIGLAIGQLRPEVDVPVPTGPDLADDLPRLTAALRDQARRETAATGWLPYVLCGVVATSASLYLWLGEDRPVQAGVTFGLDFLVGATQIWTVPTNAKDLWEQTYPGVDP